MPPSTDPASASRAVPPLVAVQIIGGRTATKWGWAVLGGMIAVSIWIVSFTDRVPLYRFVYGELRTVEGIVIDQGWVGGSEIEVFGTAFAYTSAGGFAYEGVSYANAASYATGAVVTIIYPAGRPDLGAIEGQRSERLPSVFLGIVLGPLLAAAFLTNQLRLGVLDFRLLRGGTFTTAKLIGERETATSSDGQTISELTFEYRDADDETHRFVVATTDADVLKDEEAEGLYYLPAKPHLATLTDDLPGAPLISPEGEVGELMEPALFSTLLWPSVTIVGLLWYLAA